MNTKQQEVFQHQATAKTSGGPRLVLSTYRPALSQARVRRRIKEALNEFLPYYRGRERQIHQEYLERFFGKHQNDMYGWMRANLLREVRAFSVPAKRATTYVVYKDGFDKLWKLMYGTAFNYAPERANQIRPVMEPYITGVKELPLFQKHEGGRIYGPHQYLERDVRSILLPACYDYDIQAAMPTLVLQSTGSDWGDNYKLWRMYLGNRKQYREDLAKEYDLTIAQAKEVFQLLFSGAMFNGSRYGIGGILGPNKVKKALKDPWLLGLKNEAHTCWCRVGIPSKRGPERFAYYEQLEQQIMLVVYQHLHDKGDRYWPFHDGFTMITGKADVVELRKLVKEQTGYSVIFEEKQL